MAEIRFVRFLLIASILAVALAGAHPALADSSLRVFIDLDNNPLTGCDSAVPGGTFSGAEIVVLTTIDDATNLVTGVSRQECYSGATSFGPPMLHSLGGWGLGSDLGIAGSDVIETFVPLSFFHVSGDQLVRLGFSIEEIGVPGSGDAILLNEGEPLEFLIAASASLNAIPTMTFWGNLALILILSLTALFVLRRKPQPLLIAALTLGLAASSIGLVWGAIMMNGDPADWDGILPLAVELPPEPVSLDLIAVFATVTDGRFYVRADVFFDEPPVAEDDDAGGVAAYATLIDTPLNVPDGPGDPVERNDFAGKPEAPIVSFGGADLGGAVTDNAADTTISPLPQGGGSLRLDADGSFDFTPPTGYLGDYAFQYRVENSEGVSDATVTIAVQQPPTAVDDFYETDPGTIVSRSTAAPDDPLDNDVLSHPPATLAGFGGGSLPGDATNYAPGSTVPIGADGSLTVNSNGSFSFTPETGATSTFTFDYLLQNSAGSDTATITIDIRELPVITSDGGGATASLNVEENLTAVTDVQATDPDGDTEGAGLTFSLSGGIDLALFSIDAGTGVLTFDSAPDFENPIDANTDNQYEIQVAVTDSYGFFDEQNISVSVTNAPNEAPVITSNGGGATATVRIGGSSGAVTTVQSIDPDGETGGLGLVYSIAGGADQAWFSIDAWTGVLTINGDGSRFTDLSDANADAVFEARVAVTDSGGLSDVQDISVTYIQLSLGNRVWQDGDNNQIQTPGESGINGVLLDLFQLRSWGTALWHGSAVTVRDSVTQEDGYFIFDDLPEGEYQVRIAPRNFHPGSDDGDPSNGVEGILYSSMFGGPYFSSEDTDLTHLLDNGRDLNDNGMDENFPATNGILTTRIRLGINTEPSPANLPDDVDLNTDVGEGTSGEPDSNADMTVDFGIYIPAMSLGNRVFLDANDNRQLDAGEAGVESVVVNLFKTDGAGNVVDQDGDGGSFGDPDDVIDTDLTDSGGYYIFDGLRPGYYVVVVDEINFLAGGVLQGYSSSQDAGTPTDSPGSPLHDNDVIEDGIDSNTPEVGGIRSPEITLIPGDESVTETDKGPEGDGEPNIQVTNSNLTVDFGFYIP